MTLIPVSKMSTTGRWFSNAGGWRWMDHLSLACTGPFPSMASPRTLNMRPSTPSPTGTEMGAPVAVTAMPRPRPSLGESMMQRTVSPPTCWATSMTSRRPSNSTSRASFSSGRAPPSKATSTTGPMTCTMVPCFSLIMAKSPFGRWYVLYIPSPWDVTGPPGPRLQPP